MDGRVIPAGNADRKICVLLERWINGIKPLAQSNDPVRSITTVHAVATDNSFRGSQFRTSSCARHVEILPGSVVVSGFAALVTTALRSVVTRAPSDQASSLMFRVGVILRPQIVFYIHVNQRSHPFWSPQDINR